MKDLNLINEQLGLEMIGLKNKLKKLKEFIKTRDIPFDHMTIEGERLHKSVILFNKDKKVIAIVGHKVKRIIFEVPINELEDTTT